jgi:protein-S-isoprenylcysteine O-methyltransferase Ste14
MIDRLSLILGIGGGWIISGIAYFILKRVMKDRLPRGSIVDSIHDDSVDLEPPGTFWSRLGVTFTMSVNMAILLTIVFLELIDSWNIFASFVTIDLPLLVNWAGLVGLWFYLFWGTVTLVYNPNYITLYKRLPEKNYVLATGGPYSIVRHPMYVAKGFVLPFLIFLTTGTWLVIVGLTGWVAFPSQAEAEEKILERKFGRNYHEYVARTGRFFPKFRKTG